MNTKKKAITNFIKKYSKKKRTWALLIIIIGLLYLIFKPAASTDKVVIDTARFVDLKQTVLATGQVTSNTDLSLSFNSGGIVKNLRVKVGDVVKKGTILATLDQGAEIATLTQSKGVLAAARAKYKKTIDGVSNEEITLAQVILDQTKLTQSTLVENAYQNLLNSTLEVVPENNSNDYVAPTISGTYRLNKEGIIKIKTYPSSGGYGYNVSGLTSGSGLVTTINPQPIGNSGLYIKFPSSTTMTVSDWMLSIPNKNAVNYLSNYNAYQLALSQSKLAIEQKVAELAIKKANARGADLDLAEADIVQAEGQVQAAESKYENTIIRAPADGTITAVDIKLGELAQVQKPVIVLQDISHLYIDAKINESSIANVKLGQKVTMTFDAFGTTRLFNGTVIHIDPGATTTGGVVNYKIKSSILSDDPSIRSGMNADINILTAEKAHVIVIPKAAVYMKDSKSYVKLVIDKKHKKYIEQEIQTGLTGDGNLIEVVSGLTDGQDIDIVSK